MRIAISSESTIDLPKELLEKYDIRVIPFEILLGDETFTDGEKTNEEVFAFVDAGGPLPKTTAINDFRYNEYFEDLLKEYDAVIHIGLSSGISSTVNNATRVALGMKNVYVLDSMSLTTGIALLAIYARQLTETIKDPKKIVEMVSARIKSLQVSFIVERLDYLHKGGRCSSVALLGANLMKIRPSIKLQSDTDGKMVSYKKYRGKMSACVEKYVIETLAECNTPDLSMAFITYSSATEEMINSAYEQLKLAGFKEIIKTTAGATVSSHCGANTLGVIYFNDGNN